MKESKTRGTGAKTQAIKGVRQQTSRLSASQVDNKHPDFDYCFVRKVDIEKSGGVYYGYMAVDEKNNNGETAWVPPGVDRAKLRTTQIHLEDTILCRRPKETTAYYAALNHDKASRNFQMVRDSAKHASRELNKLDPDSYVEHSAQFSGTGFSQAQGPTEE